MTRTPLRLNTLVASGAMMMGFLLIASNILGVS